MGPDFAVMTDSGLSPELGAQPTDHPSFQIAGITPLPPRSSIRSRLRQWQIGNSDTPALQPEEESTSTTQELNNLTRPESTETSFQDPGDQGDDTLGQSLDQLTGRDAEYEDSATILEQGDLLELPGSPPSLAVYLKYVDGYHVSFNQSGALNFSTTLRALFLVKALLSPKELKPILSFTPNKLAGFTFAQIKDNFASAVPRHLGKHVVSKLNEFQQESGDIYRKHAGALDNAHQILAHPTEARAVHLKEAAVTLTGIGLEQEEEITEPLLHAVSTALLTGVFGFKISNRSYAETRYLVVEPQASADSLNRVLQSVRAYREQNALTAAGNIVPRPTAKDARPLEKFMNKATELICESRKLRLRSPDGFVVSTDFDNVKEHQASSNARLRFSESDLDFIRVLALYNSAKTLSLHPILRNLPMAIVRSTGMYPKEELDTEILHSFLIEIGSQQPHTNPICYDRPLLLSDGKLEEDVSEMQTRIDSGEDVDSVANLNDSMNHIRRDWGDMPIFVVDSPSAQVLEDGLSLEKVPGSKGDVWVHVHITSPTAYLNANGIFSKLAANRVETTYLPDSRVSMFPPWFAQRFSLKADCPVMTFSSLVDSAGKLVDYKIQHGIVRNIKVLTTPQVDAIFGYEEEELGTDTYIVGSQPQETSELPEQPLSLSTDDTAILRHMMSVSMLLHSRRFHNPFASLRSLSRISVDGRRTEPLAFQMQTLPVQPTFLLNEPGACYSISRDFERDIVSNGEIQKPSTAIVSAHMLLAGEVAARWAADRHIPIPYVGSRKFFDSDDQSSPRSQMEDMFTGRIPYDRRLLQIIRQQYAMRYISPQPSEWRSMGISHYTKPTSPLRRYYDILTHWQIDAALLEEHRTGQSLATKHDKDGDFNAEEMAPACLPFSYRDMEKRIAFGEFRSRDIADFSRNHMKHWKVQVIARGFYLGRPKLPEMLTVHFDTSDYQRLKGIIDQLDIPCDTPDQVAEDGKTEVRDGERWEVKIKAVLPAAKRVVVTPVRKLSLKPIYMSRDLTANEGLEKSMPA